ncbi:MAG: hypothetical protein IJW57_06210 [Spirochaetaceae bacterium]|nr:hypothetical protein [Spirochaetaceae bacterium]
MKRFFLGALTLIMISSLATGQASLLNEATNGLFRNVNDFVIKPNSMFNTVDSKQVIVGGGFNAMGLEGNSNSGALLGYYHPSAIRWSTAAYLKLTSEDHKVEENFTEGNVEVQHKNPAFERYDGGVRFTLGLPDTLNMSAGLLFLFDGNTTQPIESTRIENDTETVTVKPATNTAKFTMGIPVGLEFTPSIYNYFSPIVHITQTTTIAGNQTGPDGQQGNGSEDKDTAVAFTLYDKLTIQNLLPAPLGSETAFWIAIGNMELSKIAEIDELEKPAYTTQDDTANGYSKLKFATQIGMSNLLSHSVGGIDLKMKPMVYFDILAGDHKSATFGATIAAAAGIYAPLGKLPMVLFCGVTPSLQFYSTTYHTEKTTGNTTTTDKAASRALTTNVLWSGKVGTSILLPRDMVLDVTFNVNNNTELSLGLSAQMTIAL